MAALVAMILSSPPAFASDARRLPRPNVLVISVDTLRADRLSSYGYFRRSTPNIDRLLARGARFAEARTVEPLTGPSMASMLTSRYPHEHGATRNAMRIRPGLSSASRILRRNGYATAAFVSNWTLRSSYSGLGEHFHEYHEVFTRKRWLGLFKGESAAADVTEAVLDWLGSREGRSDPPFFLWAHYTDPHAPYLFRREHAEQLGIPSERKASPSDRYDTEIAAVDAAVGDLVEALDRDPRLRDSTLVVFLSDHGESFGEHGAWGHGRTLWEEAVRIPLGFVYPARVPAAVIAAPARLIDIAPTILGLAGASIPTAFRGHDWTAVLTVGASPPALSTLMEAHRGAVLRVQNPDAARRTGLLEIAIIDGGRKESWHTPTKTLRVFDLRVDPREENDLAPRAAAVSPALGDALAVLEKGLRVAPAIPATLDAEGVEKLRSLGYLD